MITCLFGQLTCFEAFLRLVRGRKFVSTRPVGFATGKNIYKYDLATCAYSILRTIWKISCTVTMAPTSCIDFPWFRHNHDSLVTEHITFTSLKIDPLRELQQFPLGVLGLLGPLAVPENCPEELAASGAVVLVEQRQIEWLCPLVHEGVVVEAAHRLHRLEQQLLQPKLEAVVSEEFLAAAYPPRGLEPVTGTAHRDVGLTLAGGERAG